MIELKRPIVFFDTETTGVDPSTDRIVEISIYKVNPDGEAESKTRRINPEMHIPEASTEIHGIKDEDVQGCPTFKMIAKSLLKMFEGCDLAGFNSNRFDCPLLYNEFLRSGIEWKYKQHHFIDIGNIFKIMEPRTLTAAVKFYLNREHEGAHGADADTKATAEIFVAMSHLYESELPNTIEGLELFSNYDAPILDLSGRFTSDKEGNIILNFGRYRGELAEDHLDFVDWMYSRANFPPDTNEICEQLLIKNKY